MGDSEPFHPRLRDLLGGTGTQKRLAAELGVSPSMIGKDVKDIRCPRCGNLLGREVAGWIVVTRKGREVIGQIIAIRCERCRSVWAHETAREGGDTKDVL